MGNEISKLSTRVYEVAETDVRYAEAVCATVGVILIYWEFSRMRLRLLLVVTVFLCCLPVMAQVKPAATSGGNSKISVGAGIDYWRGDWSHIKRYGPAAWVVDEFWHGLGVTAEGYSMMAGGPKSGEQYKFFVGQGGAIYTYHWHRLAPYAKGELGFGGLSFPHKTGAIYVHDTRTTWAMGGGAEFKLWSHIWLRGDYTYEGFPDFYSSVTGQHHTLDPSGFAAGVTYHLR